MKPVSTAILRNLRVAPRKVRLVVDAIRGKNVRDAEQILRVLPNKSAGPVLKLVRSAVANAKQQAAQADEDHLSVFRIKVDEGAKLKRWMPRSRGQAYEIQKKTSHITVVLSGEPERDVKKNAPSAESASEQKSEKAQERKEKKQSPSLAIKPKVMRTGIAKTPKEKNVKRVFRRKAMA